MNTSEAMNDGIVCYKDHWFGSTWFLVGFLLMWSGITTAFVVGHIVVYSRYCHTHECWPFGERIAPLSTVVHGEVSVFVLFAIVGPTLFTVTLATLLRRRSQLALNVLQVRDESVLHIVRTFLYNDIVSLNGIRDFSTRSPLFVIKTNRGQIRFGRSVEGWPGFIAELWRRCPHLKVNLPERLERRIRSVRDHKPVSVVLKVPHGEPLKYRFGSLYVWLLSACGVAFGMFSILPAVGGFPWDMILIVYGFIALAVMAGVVHYRYKYARYLILLHPDGMEFTDHRHKRTWIPWGEVIDFDIEASGGGSSVFVYTPTNTISFRAEIVGWDRLRQALGDALDAFDRQL